MIVIMAAHKVFNTSEGDPLIDLPELLVIVGVMYFIGRFWKRSKDEGG